MPPLTITPKQLEALCVILSLTSTGLAALKRRETWLLTLLASFLNGYLYWRKAIFGHFFLDIYYIATALAGWIYWSKQPKKTTTLKKNTLYFTISGGGISALILSRMLVEFKGNAPLWDAISTISAMIAQVLLSQQILENWIFWIIHDLAHLVVCYQIGLYLQCAKILIYILIGGYGWHFWKKQV
jgi:nicotinamide mononucleotide transporter